MKKSAPTSKPDRKRKPFFSNPEVEKKAADVYKDGFNIYMYVGRLKKNLKRTEDFPDAVMFRFFDAYWKYRCNANNNYTYFIKTFQMVSADWHANQHQQEHAQYKKEPMAQSIKDIMKNMFN